MNETLLLLASEVRGKTLWLLEGVTDEMGRFVAPGLANSLLWHAGHVLTVVEHLAVAPATGRPPELPEEWFEKFGWDSRPQTIKQWPPISDVVAALHKQLPRLLSAISAISPQQLQRVIAPSEQSIHYDIVHGLHDEANHQGEMWLLRKMLKRKPT